MLPVTSCIVRPTSTPTTKSVKSPNLNRSPRTFSKRNEPCLRTRIWACLFQLNGNVSAAAKFSSPWKCSRTTRHQRSISKTKRSTKKLTLRASLRASSNRFNSNRRTTTSFQICKNRSDSPKATPSLSTKRKPLRSLTWSPRWSRCASACSATKSSTEWRCVSTTWDWSTTSE